MKNIRILISIGVLILFFSMMKTPLYALGSNSFITVVNPVRAPEHWLSNYALENQIRLIVSRNIHSTWLVQYSLLSHDNSLKLLKNLPKDQEIGLFLEIDDKLATKAKVPYLYGDGDWARPDKIFLSGYTPSERKRLIDEMMSKFYGIFGFYPKAVGAWYIDTLSLNYLKHKYGIEIMLDCSDQFRTDKYGLWGKPWGVPYETSKINSLLPPVSKSDTLGIVKIQWAQRDPVLGYGRNVADSTYSVQANDYISAHSLNIKYFKHLADIYLLAYNPVNQLTVGLETGEEGVRFAGEFEKQLEQLLIYSKNKQAQFTTMSGFAQVYREMAKDAQSEATIRGESYFNKTTQAIWYSSPFYRVGFLLEKQIFKIRDLRTYGNLRFKDIFQKDKENFLERYIPSCVDELENQNPLIIEQNVNKIEMKKVNGQMEISLFLTDSKVKKLILKEKEIYYEGKPKIMIKEKKEKLSDIKSSILGMLLTLNEKWPHFFIGGIRYSEIEGIKYFGIMTAANKLAGISTKPPFAGLFTFPFQTLIRFKSGPSLNLAKLISNLDVYSTHCTIEI